MPLYFKAVPRALFLLINTVLTLEAEKPIYIYALCPIPCVGVEASYLREFFM
jgi:hypothetical protein